MYQIINGRGTGKTLQLMLLAKENEAKIACSNPLAMRDKAYRYGITGIDFISYSDLFEQKVDPETKIMIDELDNFVSNFIDGQLIGYTLTKE